MQMLKAGAYNQYIGKCPYLEQGRLEALYLVAQSIYHDFEDAQDRLLWIADGSPFVGACKGHPGNSHAHKITVDVDYYTLLHKNHTQRWGPGGEPVQIWEEPGVSLLTQTYDIERNFIFLARILQVMPGSTYRTNAVLKEELRLWGNSRYGWDLTTGVIQHCVGDQGVTYNHHTHAHLDLTEFNKDFRISEFNNWR